MAQVTIKNERLRNLFSQLIGGEATEKTVISSTKTRREMKSAFHRFFWDLQSRGVESYQSEEDQNAASQGIEDGLYLDWSDVYYHGACPTKFRRLI